MHQHPAWPQCEVYAPAEQGRTTHIRGNVRLDKFGHAEIACCESGNLAVDDAVYTLTPIGSSARGLYVSKELSLNERVFEISIDDDDDESESRSGIKVSWAVRVTTIANKAA